ncbi:hypothetical protein [[Phormidium ambiguum] IAM M-71]|uniref:hypothetical protein n=1 Tax=[Phormidium ambiguum] IAM M-71 TaxID=454136 RepID=UPI0011612B2C|nr:hypothetical protein [Phormidium ambiguum]
MVIIPNPQSDTVDLKAKLFGKIDNQKPLNCKSCGSRNLHYIKKPGLTAVCCDCGGSFRVAKAIAPYIEHLAKHANSSRNTVDFLPLFAGGESHE